MLQIQLVAFALMAMGGVSLLRPHYAATFFDGNSASPMARNEIRAVYGGFGIAFGGVCLWAVYGLESWREGIWLAIAVALLGMAAGRMVSAIIEKAPIKAWIYCLIEAAAGGILLNQVL